MNTLVSRLAIRLPIRYAFRTLLPAASRSGSHVPYVVQHIYTLPTPHSPHVTMDCWCITSSFRASLVMIF